MRRLVVTGKLRIFASAALLACLVRATAAEPKPVPRMQAVPLPGGEVSLQRDGVELARYHSGRDAVRPFVFPVNGPAGRSLTRMGHPHDPESHSHHTSVWLSHAAVNGLSFWEDRTGATIAQQRVRQFGDGDDTAFIETENAWLDKEGKPVLHELRRTTARPLEKGEWLLEIDTQVEARSAEVTLGQTPFGLIGVRMAKTIGVHDGGGTIRNSEGGVDEAGCFRKPARWVDYSGPITATAVEGITLMDHPTNLHHPVPFHVRDDGWMGAALTFPAAHTIAPGEPLRLRYALYVHGGTPAAEAVEKHWAQFAASAFPEFKREK